MSRVILRASDLASFTFVRALPIYLVWVSTHRWQALFGSALDAGDDFSDTTSQASVGKQGSVRAGRASTRAAPSVAASVKSVPTKKVDSRPVSVLKPKVRYGFMFELDEVQRTQRHG